MGAFTYSDSSVGFATSVWVDDKGCGYQLTKVFLRRYARFALILLRYILSYTHEVRL